MAEAAVRAVGAAMVVGIDVGFANLSLCALMSETYQVVRWTNQRICHTKSENTVFWATREWLESEEIEPLLAGATAIVLEHQLRQPFQMMNTIIRCAYPNKTTIVSPKTMCAKYRLPLKREAKKKATIEWVTANIGAIEETKQDDMADSALLAHYGLNYLI